MGIVESNQFDFTYDNDESAITNFNLWYSINCEERSGYGEKIYTFDQAKSVFENIYMVKV